MTNPKPASRFSTASKNYTKFPNKILHATGLNAVEKIIIAYIGSVAVCYASQAKLAEVCDVSIKTINRSIKRLKTRGIVTSKFRHGTSSIYEVLPSSRWNLEESSDIQSQPSSATESYHLGQIDVEVGTQGPTINSYYKEERSIPVFKPNQKVICIDPDDKQLLSLGQEYTIHQINHGGAFVRLVEVADLFASSRFQAIEVING